MMKEPECLIDTKSFGIGNTEKHVKKCDWDYDDECDQESIMNEQSEEGTAPDYDSVLDNEQVI